jgi:hypothetical protein
MEDGTLTFGEGEVFSIVRLAGAGFAACRNGNG